MNINCEVINISTVNKKDIDYSTVIFKVDFPGKMDLEISNDFWVLFNTLVNGGAQKIVVDMRNVEYIDSAGIGILINTAKMLRKDKGDLVISNVTEGVKVVLDVINLEKFIKFFNTDIEAVNHFRYL
ncbi:MAG TPA: STAS domain-containing protein [Spirochaetota bacterium]|nr:STAS domain-containing protein [Spirochaetota bacterium]